jgi:hypothetical protein
MARVYDTFTVRRLPEYCRWSPRRGWRTKVRRYEVKIVCRAARRAAC